MKKIIRLIALFVLCILPVNTMLLHAEEYENVVVEIDYGKIRPARTVDVRCAKDKTVLEVLQAAATVETHPVRQYVFVASIDGVRGKRGEMAWYYAMDGKSADKLAYSNVVGNAKHIKWAYKKDVCSCKVDGEV